MRPTRWFGRVPAAARAFGLSVAVLAVSGSATVVAEDTGGRADALFAEAQSLAGTISDASVRAEAQGQVATWLARAGRIEAARVLGLAALEDMRSLPGAPASNAFALLAVTESLASAGLFAEAETAAALMPNGFYEGQALYLVGTALARNDRVDDARRMAERAYAVAMKKASSDMLWEERDRMAADIALAALGTGDTAAVRAAAEMAELDVNRARILAALAEAEERAGQTDQAAEAARGALAAAERANFDIYPSSNAWRAEAAAEAAAAFAAIGLLEDAAVAAKLAVSATASHFGRHASVERGFDEEAFARAAARLRQAGRSAAAAELAETYRTGILNLADYQIDSAHADAAIILAAAGLAADAEAQARTVEDTGKRARALAAVAAFMSGGDRAPLP